MQDPLTEAKEIVERTLGLFLYPSLHARKSGSEAKAGVGKWIEFYNRKRPLSALGGKPPAVAYWLRIDETQHDQQEQRAA